MIAVIIIVSVASANNLGKEMQFRKLMEIREERNIMIKRNGTIKNKSIKKLLVGDIIFLNQGDQIPVDGILISGFNLLVDESSQTGESKDIEKEPLRSLDISAKKVNPFLLSGSKIMEGKGEAVVCAVGVNTRMGRIRSNLAEEPDPTPLQIKLQTIVISKQIFGKYSYMQNCCNICNWHMLGDDCKFVNFERKLLGKHNVFRFFSEYS